MTKIPVITHEWASLTNILLLNTGSEIKNIQNQRTTICFGKPDPSDNNVTIADQKTSGSTSCFSSSSAEFEKCVHIPALGDTNRYPSLKVKACLT